MYYVYILLYYHLVASTLHEWFMLKLNTSMLNMRKEGGGVAIQFPLTYPLPGIGLKIRMICLKPDRFLIKLNC